MDPMDDSTSQPDLLKALGDAINTAVTVLELAKNMAERAKETEEKKTVTAGNRTPKAKPTIPKKPTIAKKPPANNRSVGRPRGRPPKGKVWDAVSCECATAVNDEAATAAGEAV